MSENKKNRNLHSNPLVCKAGLRRITHESACVNFSCV